MIHAAEVPAVIRTKLTGYASITTLPVQWGDQDAFGHVNNIVYFRWFESSRIDFLEALHTHVSMKGTGIGPILAAINCEFRRQLRFPDTVYVGSKVTRVGRSSADIAHAVVSREQGEIVAEGKSVVVIFNYEAQRVTRIPEELRKQFELSVHNPNPG
ncbi:MAG: acyl-CoA thioesterase [Planctomycetaceae bacterium]|nr:acyl-CoA thioesterase [Planctomycetaceae bacterium]